MSAPNQAKHCAAGSDIRALMPEACQSAGARMRHFSQSKQKHVCHASNCLEGIAERLTRARAKGEMVLGSLHYTVLSKWVLRCSWLLGFAFAVSLSANVYGESLAVATRLWVLRLGRTCRR